MEHSKNTPATLQKLGRTLTPSELSVFCLQLSMILKSGITLADGISVMLEDLPESDGKQILQTLDTHVSAGASLHTALVKTGVFPEYMVNMVKIGEAAGRLDEVMQSLGAYYERESDLRSRIRSAVIYPVLLIAMMSVVIFVLVIKVLPIFEDVLSDFGADVSAAMRFSMSAGRYALIALGLLVFLIVLLALWSRTRAGTRLLGRAIHSFALTKDISAKMATGRFASAMSLMLASGLNTDEALSLAPMVVDNPQVAQKISACTALTEQGMSFAKAAFQTKLFSGLSSRMVTVGFKSGYMDAVLAKIAEAYNDEVDGKLSGAINLIEPTLVAILSIVIGVILISVMLPLMGIMSGI